MLMGIRLQAHPTAMQKLTLSQWMGCARFVWNAKCEEDQYLSRFARKYLPVGTYAPINQCYSQYKDEELSPWLKKCPSQVLRNSVVNWKETYDKFLAGKCGKPKRKKKSSGGSIYLTRELFRFERCTDGVTRLFIGTPRNSIGYLSVRFHAKISIPKSLRIKKKNGHYWVSFCYDDKIDDAELFSAQENLDYLKDCSADFLAKYTVGVDRGVVRPVQCGDVMYDFTKEQKRKKRSKEKYIKRYQRQLARQKKGSVQREKTKQKIARSHEKIVHIRTDFCHKVSRSIVDQSSTKIIVFEDLKAKNMTRRAKAKPNIHGTWDRNNAKSKSGLNRSILDKAWHKLENFTKYKANRAGKAFFKVSAYQTSQECADCSHTHPNNRKSQGYFHCDCCGHTDNADRNAAKVIKKRAIKLILNSGTELSKSGVLLDSGRGAKVRHSEPQASCAVAKKRQKRKESSSELLLEASPLQG